MQLDYYKIIHYHQGTEYRLQTISRTTLLGAGMLVPPSTYQMQAKVSNSPGSGPIFTSFSKTFAPLICRD
ncbi:unnamed protein product [Aspergillus oryzae]|uniref:Unnamed protein product n=2 Tax=Aspergillus oryzae TaxID=5062 RepID=A0AAN5BX98_ASPOZ|nr:unnamed protein product [Aspergillus oryzae]GMF83644.1 unnamed protein product [Aspergillus oryzae]GMG11571.1 unnamed protein product [Aspergillus oryzae]GMG29041.1 unnamed protein product [Aspergillus oryzae]GMG53452.1 unnamed protein product [Aspergillus oryzae var. brunneus]